MPVPRGSAGEGLSLSHRTSWEEPQRRAHAPHHLALTAYPSSKSSWRQARMGTLPAFNAALSSSNNHYFPLTQNDTSCTSMFTRAETNHRTFPNHSFSFYQMGITIPSQEALDQIHYTHSPSMLPAKGCAPLPPRETASLLVQT